MATSSTAFEVDAIFERLRIGTIVPDCAPARVPAFLDLLATLVRNAPERVVCVVLPRIDDTAMALATLVSMSRFQGHFSELVSEYLREQFRDGELVSVLPTNLVYEFAGFFPELHGLRFKLRILGTTSAEARSCPADEALRLVRTDRRSPKGKSNSNLGVLATTPMDRLLGVRTFGNPSILRNEVLLNCNASDFESFVRNLTFARSDAGPQNPGTNDSRVSLADAFPWGTVREDGTSQPFNERDGTPICAVARSLQSIGAAADQLAEDRTIVLVDGATRVQNVDILLSIGRRQRVVVLADVFETESLEAFRRAGVVVWQPHAADLLGTSADAPPAGVPGASTLQAAQVLRDRQIETLAVKDAELDEAALMLRDADSRISVDTDVGARQLVGECFGILARVSEWLIQPSKTETAFVAERLRGIAERHQLTQHFLPRELSLSLGRAVACLTAFAGREFDGSGQKLRALSELLGALENLGERSAVILTSRSISPTLSEFVSQRWTHASVYTPRDVPHGCTYDRLILAAWPTQNRMDKILGWFNAPRITLFGYEHERHWMDGYLRRQASSARSRSIEGEDRTRLLGLPPSAPRVSLQQQGDGLEATQELESVVRLERLEIHQRKGSAALSDGQPDSLQAKYVSFVGSGYAYLTPTHRVPRINGLLHGDRSQKTAVEQVFVDDLQPGDSLLFRPVGSADVISLIAEEMYGKRYAENRKLAESWRTTLRTIGSNPHSVHQSLRRRGLTQHVATVRGWMTDAATIGPQSESDIRIIADAAKDSTLQANAHSVFEAIREVRGNHMQAGTRLSEMLIAELPGKVHNLADEETRLDLTFGDVWIVQVAEVAPTVEERSYIEVNRLLFDEHVG